VVVGEVQDAGDGVAHDHGPQVLDVHFRRDIGEEYSTTTVCGSAARSVPSRSSSPNQRRAGP
jgi:hypothetical protein